MAAPKTIRRGDTGAEVTLLQQRLGLPLAQFGVFDAYTEQQVKAYQRAKGLAVDGVVGPKTWAALGVTNMPAVAAFDPKVLLPNSIYTLPTNAGGYASASASAGAGGVPAGSTFLWSVTAQNQFASAFRLSSDAGTALGSALAAAGFRNVSVANRTGLNPFSMSFEVTGQTSIQYPTTGALQAALEAAAERASLNTSTTGLQVANSAAGINKPPSNPADLNSTVLLVGVVVLVAAVVLGR